MWWVIAPVVSYLSGSIPFGFILVYLLRGIDIRKCGSGNIGATNAARTIGKKWGVLVFALDFIKGLLPVAAVCIFLPGYRWLSLIAALAAVSGHNWSIFLSLRGGKGVSTSLGAISGLCFEYHGLLAIIMIVVVAGCLLL